jgi:beta-glucosidase
MPKDNPMLESAYPFPSDFLWGTATAAHQVEGGNEHNDWWAWEKEGKVWQGIGSGAACDWWAGRAEEDIARMVALNTNAHRLSVEWSRIEPEHDVWDEDAIARYRDILTAMRAAGIAPMVTLHHFTNPEWLREKRFWGGTEIVDRFVRFVEKIVPALADLCDTWCTINEPNVYAARCFITGHFPPGSGGGQRQYYTYLYQLLRAHAAAYHTIHRIQPQAKVGLAMHMVAWFPRRPNHPLDLLTTRTLDRDFNDLTLKALSEGKWTPLLARRFAAPELKGTLDWIGLNYYHRYDCFFDTKVLKSFGLNWGTRPASPKGPSWWGELYPAGMHANLKRLHEQFGLPIYITENGVPDCDDAHRPRFIVEHLREVWQAIQDGIPVKGYYHWSLVDNFEWHEGYNPEFQFGLYAVDFKTQERTLRESGKLYAEICKAGGITEEMIAEAQI